MNSETVINDRSANIDHQIGARSLDCSEHIVFVNSSMVCGGAERVISILARSWASSGKHVTLITIHSSDSDHYSLDPKVNRRCLDANRASANVVQGIWNNLTRIRKLRQAIKEVRPTVLISFQDTNNVVSLIASMGLGIPTIVSERNDPRMRPISRAWDFLRRKMYRNASALVVQTHALSQWGAELVGSNKIHVLPNPVVRPGSISKISPHADSFIVAAGRLVKQKGFDILLNALANCEKKWLLKIAGDGPEKSSLEEQAKRLGISDQVEFLGTVENLNEVFRNASLYALSSRFEGFPNVLTEAMACGLAVVSFDCPSGPAEIVRHGVDGILVEPENCIALSQAIDRLMLDSVERNRLAENAPEVVDRFAESKIVDGWNDIIYQVSNSCE